MNEESLKKLEQAASTRDDYHSLPVFAVDICELIAAARERNERS